MDTQWQQTACILCSVNCGIEVQTKDGHITRIRGDRAHPASRGYACEKAQRLDHYQNGRHRLSTSSRAARTARSSRSTGTPPFVKLPSGWSTFATRTAALRSSITAAADREIIWGAATAPPLAARWARYASKRAGARKDGRILGRRSTLRPPTLPYNGRLRTRRGRDLRRQEPLAVAWLPTRQGHAARNRG